jgi:hypothetical protein
MPADRRRAYVCAERLVGARSFSDREMLDPLLRRREGLRRACDRLGPLSASYYRGAFARVRLEMPVEQAESLIMTLPQLLACALRQRTGDQDARYVFGLGEWAIESTKGQDCLIATLKTPDGFEVCFGIPFAACRSLGWNLLRAAETHDPEEQQTAQCRLTLN